uniref:Uncharacterized protein n=1 Tax=uncultured prokaryote TaxID=198431 RepID=A0A0H5Q1K1_9ZZZZ|nr:hypothetical protein [uncultured prokaryote]
MAGYRYQVVSVGMWRGKIKRWNTTFHTSSSSSAAELRTAVSKVSWPNPGDTLGACSGGVASISTYNAAGGAPIAVATYFDWQVPSTWIPFTGTSWVGVDEDTPLDAAGESAVIIQGRRPGLSSTGKPVFMRKYFHAVPSRTSAAFEDPDVASATAISLAAAFNVAYFANKAGVYPSTLTALPWYGNHQRVRGRRRSALARSADAFAGGVVLGTGVAPGDAPSQP